MSGLWNDITGVWNTIYRNLPGVPVPKEVQKVIIKEVDTMVRTRGFIRLAGVSGALSVAMAAYGAHGEFCWRARSTSRAFINRDFDSR